ncbi:MAG TPA: hypothetical protein VNI57_03030 [Candidatus Saccharimonadales bacterium]|nr:hypothetical protein [Candidatus Saccharimonadales bacterium]
MRSPHRAGRVLAFAAVSIAALGTAGHLRAQQAQILRPEDALIALYAVQTEIDVEQTLLKQQETRYQANVQTRASLRERLDGLYAELEELFQREQDTGTDEGEDANDAGQSREAAVAAAQEKEEQIRSMERAQEAARDDGRAIRDEIRKLMERIRILDEKQSALRLAMPDEKESVTGLWDVRLMPSGDRGVFALWQSGTIISGQYVLDGPFHGSLEGTLINRQILIRRIDSALGRTMELSGYLSDDGRSVQGTWLNYDLSSGKAPTGSWTARKRASSSSQSAGPGTETP